MARHSSLWLPPVAFVCLLNILGCSVPENRDWPEHADPDIGVSLRVTPETQTIKAGESPHFTALLLNTGKHEVILVESGDGSDCGWRTPLVEWSHRQPGGGRCGNINALKPDEVITLAAGGSHELKSWIGEPYLPKPGRYRVTLRYSNEPQREWSGLPLGKHDPKAWEAIRRSTAVAVVSNTVEIIVE